MKDLKFFLFFLILPILILAPFFLNPQALTKRNGDFSDLVWPDYYFIKQSFVIYHQIPLWNPTLFSGIPEIANPQSPIIYPPNVLSLILPIDIAIVLLIILHFFIAGLFMYLVGRRLFQWDIFASLGFTFCFILSPFLWGKASVGHISQLFATLLFAPVLYFGINSFLTGKRSSYLFLSLTLSLQYLNHPTIWFYSIFFGGIFWSYFSILEKKFWKIIFLIISLLLSLAFIAPVFLLQIQAGPLITRSSLHISDLSLPIWSIRRFLTSIFIPSSLINSSESEVWLYPSLTAVLVSIFGFIKLKLKLKFIFAAVLGLVSLITLGSRTPFFGFLVTYIPGFSYLRVATRDWFIMIVLLSFLCGFFVNSIRKKRLIFYLLFLDLLIFSILRVWFIPEVMFAKNSINFEKLLTHNDFRYYCTSRCLSARETLPKNIFTADGYHLIILKNYRNTISSAGGFLPPKYTGNIPSTDDSFAQPSAKLLGNLAVGWVISKNKLLDSNFIYKAESNGYNLYENSQVLQRVRFRTSKNNVALILLDSPNIVRIETSGEKDTLILSDTFYPGWEVWVDGKRAELLIEDDWARAVNLDEGKHLVEFNFKPFSHILE